MEISLSDLFALFKRSKRKILYTVAIFSFLGAAIGLLRPIVYVAKATFRDKAANESGMQDASASLKILGLSDSTLSEALSWMKSRQLIGKMAERLNLQAEIELPFSIIGRIRDNIIAENAFWRGLKRPSLPDLERKLVVKNVAYLEEFPTKLLITALDSATFQVSERGKEVGTGTFGEPFQIGRSSFTLSGNPTRPVSLTLWPLWKVTDDLVKVLQIRAETKDKTLYNLTFAHRDRYLACTSLNSLMDLYLEQMRHEHRFLLQEHLSYLQKRQDEMNKSLKSVLESHVSTLSSDLSTSGFPSSQSVIEYLSETQLQYTKGLHAIEMEIIRLKNFREGGFVYHDHYRSEDDSLTINATLSEIRQLKKQSDVIELALRSSPLEQTIAQKARFAELIAEHHNLQTYSKEVKEILAKLKGNQPLEKSYQLFKEPRYIAGVLQDSSHFALYLNNLDHFFDVYDKTLKERITHQQNPPDEWQGMNLATAQEVYGGFCKLLGDIESSRRQLEYVLEQMENPAFEISSLSAVLEDLVSQKLIEKASHLELSLKDEGNRSAKEQERLRTELATHRGFLQTHVHQSLELIRIREKLMHEKTYHLQQTTLELIQQQISILQKYLEDFIETRLANLEQEKQFIYQQQKALSQEMVKIPGKWVSEKMIDSQVKLNQQLMTELTKLVENKNISTNLDVVRSSPVDIATPSVHPRPPKILIFSLVGGILGLFFSCTFLFGRALVRGFPISGETLRLAKQHVSGSLVSELEALRSLAAHFDASRRSAACRDLLLVLGNGPNYSEHLATLLSKMENRVVLLPLSFDKAGADGLLAYLEGKIDTPKIHKNGPFDFIEPGGISRWGGELVSTPRFKAFYQDLSSRYDWVIAYTTAMPTSAEAQGISANFERIVLSLQDETLEELFFWTGLSEKKVSYIFC